MGVGVGEEWSGRKKMEKESEREITAIVLLQHPCP